MGEPFIAFSFWLSSKFSACENQTVGNPKFAELICLSSSPNSPRRQFNDRAVPSETRLSPLFPRFFIRYTLQDRGSAPVT
jgi:hypothetical protein